MIIFVDFDGTLHREHHSKFDLWTEPNERVVERVRKHYNDGDEIVMYSCRSNPHICDKKDEDLMINWLNKHEVPFHRIERNKPYFDYIIDDRAIHPDSV